MPISMCTNGCSTVGADLGPFRLGVNYWPADTAMAWLADYDAAVTRRDFQRIAGAGIDTIRVFLRWEDAQPAARRIDSRILGRLLDAADAATEAGVALIVTLFTGHMSGVNWIPPWAVGGTAGDRRFRVVSGGRVRRPEVACEIGIRMPNWSPPRNGSPPRPRGALSGHPAVWAWDLGNENSNCTLPPDKSTAEAWLQRMTGAIRRGDPGRLVTVGIHMEDLEEDRGIGPAEVARWCDFVSMHGYPIYAAWSAGPADTRVVPFLELLTRWLAGGTDVLFEEFGLPTIPVVGPASLMAVDEGLAAEYTGSVIDALWGRAPWAPCCGASPITPPRSSLGLRWTWLSTSAPSDYGGPTVARNRPSPRCRPVPTGIAARRAV